MDHAASIVSDVAPSEAELATPSVAKATPGPSLDTPLLPSQPANVRAERRGFAGFTYAQLAIGLCVIAAAIWGMWATSKIIVLEHRRVVSVRLASIVNDFVTAEARSGTAPEQLGVQTRAFMMALDGVLKKRAEAGEVVLVGEAVVASSVPDVTNEVVTELAKLIKLPLAAAMPPAIKPITPLAPPVDPETPSVAPAGGADTGSPFGATPSQPVETVPAQ